MLPRMRTHELRALRARLWPTRRYFEHRQAMLEAQIAALATRSAELADRVHELGAEVRRLSDGQREAAAVRAEMRTRLRRTQALTARTYEAVHDWPAALARAREADGYHLAYLKARPLISIPIPTYNASRILCERALTSVRAQSYRNWEAIVVGDHCTDDTAARVRDLGDDRIRFHNLPAREVDPADPWERWAVKGSVPRATGIELAAGSWIAPMSHDDSWDPDHLVTLLHAARVARAEVAYSRMRTSAQDGGDSAPAIGAWPPRLGQFAWQSSLFHGGLRFLRYDRACALASEPNDWNLARRAWEAGVRFEFVDRTTSTLFVHPWGESVAAELAARRPAATSRCVSVRFVLYAVSTPFASELLETALRCGLDVVAVTNMPDRPAPTRFKECSTSPRSVRTCSSFRSPFPRPSPPTGRRPSPTRGLVGSAGR